MASFSYQLPNLVRSLQEGWLISCKCAAVMSVLLAVLASELLILIKNDDQLDQTSRPKAYKFLILVSYSAVVFNCSAAVSSLILADRLGELPVRAAQISESRHRKNLAKDSNATLRPGSDVEGGGMFDEGTTSETSLRLLVKYGAGKLWVWVISHWLFCLMTGIFSIMIQILVYIFLQEHKAIQITITCLVLFAILPPIIFLLKPSSDGEA